MRTDIVEQRATRLQSERDREAATERLDQPPIAIWFVQIA
jgi:hypothetical protein